jgi:hypothetical protein
MKYPINEVVMDIIKKTFPSHNLKTFSLFNRGGLLTATFLVPFLMHDITILNGLSYAGVT